MVPVAGSSVVHPHVTPAGSASPAASNASNNSSCSNHSTHDSILTAALRAGLCRPEPVRGCSAQGTMSQRLICAQGQPRMLRSGLA
eukprot:871313-Pelagomonas_calceolata.AAC.15